MTVWLVRMNIFSISRRVRDYQKESSSSSKRESRKMERGSGCSSILKSLMNSYQWDWKKMGLLGGYTLIYIIKLPLLSIHLNQSIPAFKVQQNVWYLNVHLFYSSENKVGCQG